MMVEKKISLGAIDAVLGLTRKGTKRTDAAADRVLGFLGEIQNRRAPVPAPVTEPEADPS